MEKNKEAPENVLKHKKINFDFPWITAAIALIVLVIALSIASPMFLSTSNLMGILRQAAVYVIMGLGMSFVMMTGGVDLSQGSLLALIGVISAYIVQNVGSISLAILVSVVVGAVIGLINGGIIACLNIPPFIATLASMYLCRGLTLVITQASPIVLTDDAFKWIGTGSLAGLPVPVYIFLIAAAAGQFILSYTATGRFILAVGSNQEAARLSGIKTRWNKCKAYILSGIMVAIAGVVYVSRLGAAQATAGQSYEMEAIAAAVLGGTSVMGGEGTVFGTVLGAIVVAIVRNAMVLLEISTYYQQVVTGAVILIAVIIDTQRKARAAKRVD